MGPTGTGLCGSGGDSRPSNLEADDLAHLIGGDTRVLGDGDVGIPREVGVVLHAPPGPGARARDDRAAPGLGLERIAMHGVLSADVVGHDIIIRGQQCHRAGEHAAGADLIVDLVLVDRVVPDLRAGLEVEDQGELLCWR